MSDVIYGRNPVKEALRAHFKIQKILIAANLQHPRLDEIERLARQNDVPVQRAPKENLANLSGEVRTQGVVALVESQPYATVQQIIEHSEKLGAPPLVALLDGIEDPHNFGAILRSADAAGCHGVVVPKRRSAALTATVAKTSAGAMAHVPVARVANLNAAIDELKRRDIWIVGATQDADKIYTDTDLTGALGIVIGSEGKGLHRLVQEKCDFLVKIPMCGKVNSLNASVAAALLFFEVRRQRCLSEKK